MDKYVIFLGKSNLPRKRLTLFRVKETHSRAFLGLAYRDTHEEMSQNLLRIFKNATKGACTNVKIEGVSSKVTVTQDISAQLLSPTDDITRVLLVVRQASDGEVAPKEVRDSSENSMIGTVIHPMCGVDG